MKALVGISLAIASLSLPAAAATITAVASATILEPSVAPSIAAMPDELRPDEARFRQVNATRRDIVAARSERRNWPVVIEFE